MRPVPSYFASRAVVTEPSRMQAQVLENAWHLASCMRNHSQSTRHVNSTPTVDYTPPEPAVYIRTIVPCRINPVGPKCCAYCLLLSNISMPLTFVVQLSYDVTPQIRMLLKTSPSLPRKAGASIRKKKICVQSVRMHQTVETLWTQPA